MKIGILGGTFNPVHRSHLYLAQEYLQALALDRILFIPTHTPPHKQLPDLATARDRLAMCRLAVADRPAFQVCSYEVDREEVSYTYRTLAYLEEAHPGDGLYLLMGADMFLSVQQWRCPQAIWSRAVLCAAAREEGELEKLQDHRLRLEALGAVCRVLPLQPKPLSSTGIRERIRRGEDVSDSLPGGVWDYIRTHGLYGVSQG